MTGDLEAIAALARQLESDAAYLGDGIVKVDSMINHRVDTDLASAAGRILASRLAPAGTTRPDLVLTAETSGLIPALAAATALGVPMVYARKRQPVTMSEPVLEGRAISRTGGGAVTFRVSGRYLPAGATVAIVDDFLGSGRTALALAAIVRDAGARLTGIGTLVGKAYEAPDPAVHALGVPVFSVLELDLEGERVRVRVP